MALEKKKVRLLISILKEASKASRLEGANFDGTSSAAIPPEESCVTDFIRERTRLYRDSWITTPIENVLTELRKHA